MPDFLALIFIFILGTCFGSFANVLIDRLPQGQKITGRSHCAKCNKDLKAVDLIPLLSFLFLRGKCRKCKTAIPKRLFLVELLVGLAFVAAFTAKSFTDPLFYALLVLGVVLLFTDLLFMVLPTSIIVLFVAVSLIRAVVYEYNMYSYITALAAAGLFFLIYFISHKKGMGSGDIPLIFGLALIAPFPINILVPYLAFLYGALVAGFLLVMKKARRKDRLPFAPFLVASWLTVYFAGNIIWQAVLKQFGV